MSAINFPGEDQKQRRSDEPFDRQLAAIVERDNTIQQARAARGGAVTSQLTDEGEAAAQAVIRRRNAARAALARPVSKAALDEQARLKAAAVDAARAFLAAHAALGVLEHNANTYLAAAGQPTLPTFAGRDTDAAEFLARVERHQMSQQVTAARAVAARQPLPEPDFRDLVAS
jgi:hypothetical protein